MSAPESAGIPGSSGRPGSHDGQSGPVASADLLATIVAATQKTVEERERREPLAQLASRASARRPTRGRFRDALARTDCYNVIAECKRRSPSKGVLRGDYDPVAIAAGYAQAGAAAISVLTEPSFFDGDLKHLEAVRAAVTVPLIRKDFIVSQYQLWEAVAAGADAILLIVSALAAPELAALHRQANGLGLDVLVEVHSEDELQMAVDAGAEVIGVNNRNLRTLAVDVHLSETIAAKMPKGIVAVSESGLRTADDLQRLRRMGYSAFLIGERFMTQPDPGAGLAALLAGAGDRVNPPLVKICGITRLEDAEAAVRLGAHAVGFIFWPKSPRFIEPVEAGRIARQLPAFVTAVGVFVNEPVDSINRTADVAGLGAVQLHGDEAPDVGAAVQRPVIKAVSGASLVAEADGWPLRTVLLVDAHDPIRRGGTGRTVDWQVAAALASRRRVVLSGGLTPANIRAAIAAVQPYAVDISSGVEAAPGVKDHAKLTALFAQVREAAVELRQAGIPR